MEKTVLANLFAFSICIVWVSKGQEVSEGNCVVFIFLPQYQKSGQIKKQRHVLDAWAEIGEIILLGFLEELKTAQFPFEIS